MSLTAIKLETFRPAKLQPAPEPTFTFDDLNRARAEGFNDAQEQIRTDDIHRLCTELKRLSQSLADEQNLHHQIRTEMTSAFIPLMSEIVDALAPLHASQRIGRALADELARLTDDGNPIAARISCNGRLRGLVEECIAEADVTGIAVDDTASDCISLHFALGHIEFSNEKIVREIKEIIDELSEDPQSWTS